MYNTSYEEYMRTVLGYTPSYMQDMYEQNDYYIMPNNNDCMSDSNLNELFPDMYKKVYPLVCKECSKNTMPVTKEILEQMTDNVMNQIEIDLKIQTSVKLETRKEDLKNGRMQETNLKREDRAPQNNLLRDLIRILILRELLDRFPNRPQHPPRPPMPGPGPRPPFPGGRPPFSGGGPGTIIPRDF